MATNESSRSPYLRSSEHPHSPWSAEMSEQDDFYGEEDEESGLIEQGTLTQALGWFSIGLGLAEIFAPRALGRAIGVGEHPTVMRALGVREVVTGLGLLSERAPGAWAWARVAGDAMDLALLASAARQPGSDPRRIAMASAAVLGVGALDVYAGQKLEWTDEHGGEAEVCETLNINATPQQLYSFWRNVENLPQFMDHLESVSVTGPQTSHWIAKAIGGASVEWDSQIVDDQPDRRIGWRTLPGSLVTHEGMVSFEPEPAGRGTIVRVEMLYRPPAGKLGAGLAKLLSEDPGAQIRTDLRRLKQLLETGEVASTRGQPAGRRSLLGRSTLGSTVLGRRMQ